MPDASTPKDTVEAFISAMNAWEIASWAARRAARDTNDPASYQPTVLQSQKALFDLYCAQKDRAHGRQGDFGRPPEYDPDSLMASSKFQERQFREHYGRLADDELARIALESELVPEARAPSHPPGYFDGHRCRGLLSCYKKQRMPSRLLRFYVRDGTPDQRVSRGKKSFLTQREPIK